MTQWRLGGGGGNRERVAEMKMAEVVMMLAEMIAVQRTFSLIPKTSSMCVYIYVSDDIQHACIPIHTSMYTCIHIHTSMYTYIYVYM